MSRFVTYDSSDYGEVTIEIDPADEVTITISKPMTEWTSTRLIKAYKKAVKANNKRLMGRVREILHSKHGQDIYCRNGKIYVLTYNGCEVRV